jgi:hypothetical protein
MGKSIWMASAAVAALLGMPQVCAQGTKPATAPPAKVSAERMKILTVAEGQFHCKGPTGSSNYVKCTDIPVIVLLTPEGGCIVHVPYHELVVHSKKAETKVTWNLIAPSDYKFTQANGIELANPGNTFNRDGPTSLRTKYSWTVVAKAPAATTNHVANVVDPNGNACAPGDPAITNDPS